MTSATSRAEDQREWYWNNICMGGCDHYRPECLETDKIADCMSHMDYRLRLEMNLEVPSYQSKEDYESQKADNMHSSGEEVRRVDV